MMIRCCYARATMALAMGVALLVGCGRDDYALGKSSMEKGDFARALEHFQKAAERNPRDRRPLERMAMIYAREEKYDEAAAVLERARALEPDDPELALRAATALAQAGKLSEALATAHEALTFEKTQKDERIRRRLEEFVSRWQNDEKSQAAAAPDRASPSAHGAIPSRTATQETTHAQATAPAESHECTPLPTPPIRREDLVTLVPDNSPGRVIIRWRTETQEENLGFNIYRSETPEGPYVKVNPSLIPGEGSTNIPKDYCYEDKPLPRGKVFYYYIESVSTAGIREILEGTKGTRVKVKTVEEEREWLWRKVMGEDGKTTPSLAASTTSPLQRRPHATARPAPTAIPVARFKLPDDVFSTSTTSNEPIY